LTRQEKGNLRYDYYQDVKEPGTFVIIEQFVDMAAFHEHNHSEYFKTVAEHFKEWCIAPPEIRILKAENIKQ
jgi:quinol monooxygenase YgiN